MNYESLLEKREAIQLKVLKKLILSNGQGDLGDLSKKLNISKSSLDTYMADLVDSLKEYHDQIIISIEGNQLQLEMVDSFSLEEVQQDFYKESIKYKIIDYLFHHTEFTTVFLANELLVSESTLFRKIKELNKALKEFDISIWQGRMVGEESQIRYFYYQFYLYLNDQKKKRIQDKGLPYLEIVERALEINLSFESKEKISLWLSITKKRLNVSRLDYDEFMVKCQPYLKDPFYLKIKNITFRFLGNYAIEIEEEEAMLHFVFLLSMSILSPEDFYEYSLVRSRFSPTALLDTVVLESLLMYYKPLVFPIRLEKHTYYLLSQIHPKLYFFKGNIEIYDYHHIWEIENTLSGHSTKPLTIHLLKLAKEQLKLDTSDNESLFMTIEIKYLSIIVIIDSWLKREVTVGISLEMDELFKEAMISMLILQLSSMNGVICEKYNEEKTYDLILTNKKIESGSHKSMFHLN